MYSHLTIWATRQSFSVFEQYIYLYDDGPCIQLRASIRRVHNQGGVRGLFKGFNVSLVGGVTFKALYMGKRSEVKAVYISSIPGTGNI